MQYNIFNNKFSKNYVDISLVFYLNPVDEKEYKLL